MSKSLSGLKAQIAELDAKALQATNYQRRNTAYAAYDDYDGGVYNSYNQGGVGGAGVGAGGAGAVIERSSGYGHHHSGHGYGHKKLECCELVVDPLTFATLLAGIIGGTAFLNVVVTMVLGRKRRRRRSDGVSEEVFDIFHLGKTKIIIFAASGTFQALPPDGTLSRFFAPSGTFAKLCSISKQHPHPP